MKDLALKKPMATCFDEEEVDESYQDRFEKLRSDGDHLECQTGLPSNLRVDLVIAGGEQEEDGKSRTRDLGHAAVKSDAIY